MQKVLFLYIQILEQIKLNNLQLNQQRKNIKKIKMLIPDTNIKANQTIDIKEFAQYQVDKQVTLILAKEIKYLKNILNINVCFELLTLLTILQ